MTSPFPESYPTSKPCSSPNCTRAGEILPVSEFHKDRSKHDGLSTQCKACKSGHVRRWYLKNREYAKEQGQQWRLKNGLQAKETKRLYNLTHRREALEWTRLDRIKNPAKYAERSKRDKRKHWHKRVTQECKARAAKKGVPFDMKPEDLLIPSTGCPPTHCPVFPHIKLDYDAGEDRRCWPSVDRIVPKLGYVTGNVWVISFSANTWKYTGSNPAEHQRIIEIMTGRFGKPKPVHEEYLECFDPPVYS